MEANTIRKNLQELQRLVDTDSVFVYQALEKIASNTNTYSLRNFFKIPFFIVCLFVFKDFFKKKIIVSSNTLTFAYYDKPKYKEMWDEYLKRHDVFKKGDPVLYINTKKKKIIFHFPSLQELQEAKRLVVLVKRQHELSLFQTIFSYCEFVYCLKSKRFHTKLIKKVKLEGVKNFLTVGDGIIPSVFYVEYMKSKGVQVDSFQFFNVSQDLEYKSHTESVWLNMRADRYFVWGPAYKKFIEGVKPNILVKAVGHPLYKKNRSLVTISKKQNIIITANPPEMRHINKEFFALVFSYAKNNNYNVYLRLHPNDSLQNYSEFLKESVYVKGIPESGIYVVNNSTVYFDLIYDQKIVLRYKHPRSFLSVAQEINDYFSTEKELEILLNSLSQAELDKKRDLLLERVLGLK